MIKWSDNGNKVFWFIPSDRDGRPGIRYPDGTECWPSLKDYDLDPDWDLEKRNAYIRENLFLSAYEIWDLTAFGASMSALVEFDRWDYDHKNIELSYIFATVSHADKTVFPHLDSDQIEFCKDNVRMFYNDPNLQAGWSSLILHPISFVKEKDCSLTPVYIGDIGSSEIVLNGFEYNTYFKLDLNS